MPGLAESWKRIDERTVEFTLRKGVKFHNGDEMTADDVVFTFSRERMFGPRLRHQLEQDAVHLGAERAIGSRARSCRRRCSPSPSACSPRSRRSRRSTSTRCASSTARPTSPSKAASAAWAATSSRAAPSTRPRPGSTGRARRSATGPYKVREFVPDQSLMMDAHDDYWGGRPPLKSVRLVVVPEVASRINGLLAGQYDFICDVPPDQIPGIAKNAKFEVLGSTHRQPPHHGVRQEPSAARRSAHPPGHDPCDRPPGHRR